MSRNRKRRPAVPATVPQGFHFQWQGKGYTLPPASECHAKLSAGDLIDAVMDGSEMAQVRFGLSLLTAADIDKDTMAALRAMPITRFSQLLGTWLKRTGGGVGQGESERSSS